VAVREEVASVTRETVEAKFDKMLLLSVVVLASQEKRTE